MLRTHIEISVAEEKEKNPPAPPKEQVYKLNR